MRKVLLLFLIVGGIWAFYKVPVSSYEVNVIKTERVTSGGNSKYLVYTDKGTFENVDSWKHLKFNSSDLYGDLSRLGKFRIRTYGWRIPLISSYPNIIEEVRLQQ